MVKNLLEAYAKLRQKGEILRIWREVSLFNYTLQALAFYTKDNYILNEDWGQDVKPRVRWETKDI